MATDPSSFHHPAATQLARNLSREKWNEPLEENSTSFNLISLSPAGEKVRAVVFFCKREIDELIDALSQHLLGTVADNGLILLKNCFILPTILLLLFQFI